MTTLIVGCGYLGGRVGRLLAGRGERVYGTTRSPARADELRAAGVEPIIADVLDPGSLDALPEADRMLYCVGLDRSAGISMRVVYVDGLRNVLERSAGRGGRLVYASSTGVYGQDDGSWVDEDSLTEPVHEAGSVALDAEKLALGRQAVVLRFAGLYGPGRLPRRASLLRGEPIVGDPCKFLNMIHVDDAVAASIAALELGVPGRIYLAGDDRHVERAEFYALVAEHLGAPAPRFEPPAPGSAESRREEAHKRVSNRRMRTELGVTPRCPDVVAGVAAVFREEAEGAV